MSFLCSVKLYTTIAFKLSAHLVQKCAEDRYDVKRVVFQAYLHVAISFSNFEGFYNLWY